MSKLVTALVIMNVGFAGSTLYLARELQEVRDHVPVPSLVNPLRASEPDSDARAGGISDAEVARVISDRAERMATSTQSSATVSSDREQAEKRRRDRRRQLEKARSEQFLALYADPHARAQLVAEEKVSSGKSLRGLVTEGLVTGEELDRLSAMIAEWQVERSAAIARCRLDPGCERADRSKVDVDVIRGDIAAYLGPDRYARYREYREESGERSAVESLRSRLNGSDWMTDAQSLQLIAALADERRKFEAEVKERGGTVESYGSLVTMVAQRAEGKPRAADLESVAAFNERVRLRVAPMLSPEQFAHFTTMQEQSLVATRRQMQDMERAEARAAARKAAKAAGK